MDIRDFIPNQEDSNETCVRKGFMHYMLTGNRIDAEEYLPKEPNWRNPKQLITSDKESAFNEGQDAAAKLCEAPRGLYEAIRRDSPERW